MRGKSTSFVLALTSWLAACHGAPSASLQGIAASCPRQLPTTGIDVTIIRQGQPVDVSTTFLGKGLTGVAYTFNDPATQKTKVLKLSANNCDLFNRESEVFTSYRQGLLQEAGRAREAADYLVPTEQAMVTYDHGKYDGLIKDYISGPTGFEVVLANLRSGIGDIGGTLTADAAVNAAFDKLYFAMREAYLKGYAIRDLKDDNIIVTAEGKPVIIDALSWSDPVTFAEVVRNFPWMRDRFKRDPMNGATKLTAQGLGKGPEDAFSEPSAYILVAKAQQGQDTLPTPDTSAADTPDTDDASASQHDGQSAEETRAHGR